MSAKIEENDAAFARPGTDESTPEYGMTLKTYIATAAMQGLLAAQAHPNHTGEADLDECIRIAGEAVMYANALIDELNRD